MLIKLLLIITLSISLFAFSDLDMDGVEDTKDLCPNTDMITLVNLQGCPVKTLQEPNPHHFDIIVGLNYSQQNYTTLEDSETASSSLQLDYYYKDFSLQLSSSYYDSSSVSYNDGGVNDSFLGAYYNLSALENLNIRAGLGMIIPTYDSDLNNNKTDYTASLNVTYTFEKIDLFAGYIKTLINDEDIPHSVAYQNTDAYNLGIGIYPHSDIYLNVAYNSSDSIYKYIGSLDTASIYGYYSIDKNWFSTLSYAYGLSDSASENYFSLRLGYYF